MQTIFIPENPNPTGRVFPIVSQRDKKSESRIIGKVNLDKYDSKFSPIVTDIKIKKEYKDISMIYLLVLVALWERFGNYIISGEVELTLGVYKILTQYLGCKMIPDGLLFTQHSYITLMERIEKSISKNKGR